MAANTSSVHPSLFRTIQRHCSFRFLLGIVYVYRVLNFRRFNFLLDLIGGLSVCISHCDLFFLFTVMSMIVIAFMAVFMVSGLVTFGMTTLLMMFLMVFVVMFLTIGTIMSFIMIVMMTLFVMFLLSIMTFFFASLVMISFMMATLKFIMR